jgi:AcrR family transcriptional regulator
MTGTRRKPADVRREEILDTAYEIAVADGLASVSGTQIARRLNVSRGTVTYHVKSMKTLKCDVMKRAVRLRALGLIAQGLVVHNPVAVRAPVDLRREAAELLIRR